MEKSECGLPETYYWYGKVYIYRCDAAMHQSLKY